MAHVRQQTPDYGLGFQSKFLEPFDGVPSSRGSGSWAAMGSHLSLWGPSGHEPEGGEGGCEGSLEAPLPADGSRGVRGMVREREGV